MAISDYLTGNARPGPSSWQPYEQQLFQFFQAMEQAGYPINAHSHFRDVSYQKNLWDKAVAKYKDPEIADNWVARPSTHAPHYRGASDLSFKGMRLGSKGTEDATAIAHKLAPQFGLNFRMSNEPWHIEPGDGPSPKTSAEFSAPPDNTQPTPDTPNVQIMNTPWPPSEFSPQSSPSTTPPQDKSSGPQSIIEAYLRQLSSATPAPKPRRSETFDVIKY